MAAYRRVATYSHLRAYLHSLLYLLSASMPVRTVHSAGLLALIVKFENEHFMWLPQTPEISCLQTFIPVRALSTSCGF